MSTDFPTLTIFSSSAHPKQFKSLRSPPPGTDAYKSKLRRLLSPSCLQTWFYTAARNDHRSVPCLYVLFTHSTTLTQNLFFNFLRQNLHGALKKTSFSPTLPQAKRASPSHLNAALTLPCLHNSTGQVAKQLLPVPAVLPGIPPSARKHPTPRGHPGHPAQGH